MSRFDKYTGRISELVFLHDFAVRQRGDDHVVALIDYTCSDLSIPLFSVGRLRRSQDAVVLFHEVLYRRGANVLITSGQQDLKDPLARDCAPADLAKNGDIPCHTPSSLV